MVLYLRIVKAGLASSVAEAAKLNAREVMQSVYFVVFMSQYEDEFIRLNSEVKA